MCKVFHGRSGLHPKMLPQGLKCLVLQMMAANGGVIFRISGLRSIAVRGRMQCFSLLDIERWQARGGYRLSVALGFFVRDYELNFAFGEF